MSTGTTTASPCVGFIGLGSQGGGIARRIATSGFPLTLWARRPEALAAFADTEATVAPSAAELAARCDVIGICVLADGDVDEVLTAESGVLAGARPGTVVMVHSTVQPWTCRRLAAVAAKHDVHLIDAPVSGGGAAAEEGRLLVMVGGPEPVVRQVRPVLDRLGSTVVHLGDVGAGQATKICNNLLMAANLGVADSVCSLAEELGIDRARLAEVVAAGSGASFSLGVLSAMAFSLDALGPLAGTQLHKDVDLAVALAQGHAATGDLAVAAADHALAGLGHPRQDAAASVRRD